jgi:hypothetical protein
MRDHASVTDAESLTRRIDALMFEIEQVKRERADKTARVARARLAAAHRAKRRRRGAAERPNRAG